MKFLIINGPNLNLLGKREPGIYGENSYESLCRRLKEFAAAHASTAECFQSNHEGAILDAIHAADGVYDAIVLNPGAYTHYSYAILDALKAVDVPCIEVHISNVHQREEFRHRSVTAPACVGQICGLGLSPYFSGSKIKWILDNVEGARERAEAGDLYFGNTDSWVLWNLTGGVNGGVHCTDVTNASRTMLMDIRTLSWREDVCEIFGIPMSMLPEIKSSSEIYGYGRKNGLLIDTPIAGILGDQQAATFGQACFEKGMAKNTYGTGCFMLMNTGETPVESRNGLLTTMAWRLNGKPTYALEGSVFMGGATVQWLRDEMKLISTAAESEQIAQSISDTAGVFLVPAFTGLGAPYWDMYSRGTIVGMTRGTGRAHIVRAALEAICYQSHDLYSAMVADRGGEKPVQMNVDGGASANGFMMQFQSDILGIPVVRPVVLETTALGAALLAGIGVGLYASKEEAASMVKPDLTFLPQMDSRNRDLALYGWHRAVERAQNWVEIR